MYARNSQVFDPTLKKKKKKKKTTFDIDAAFNEGSSGGDTTENVGDKENQEPEPAVVEDDEALDLENFGKKKKKKKKAFNLDELEAALPDTKKEVKRKAVIHIFVFAYIFDDIERYRLIVYYYQVFKCSLFQFNFS